MKFRQLTEINESEGETWHFWLQVDGNEVALGQLEDYLEARSGEMDHFFPEFAFEGSVIGEAEADILVEHAEEGYWPNHQKVTGMLVLPDYLDAIDPFNLLYKGGVKVLFK